MDINLSNFRNNGVTIAYTARNLTALSPSNSLNTLNLFAEIPSTTSIARYNSLILSNSYEGKFNDTAHLAPNIEGRISNGLIRNNFNDSNKFSYTASPDTFTNIKADTGEILIVHTISPYFEDNNTFGEIHDNTSNVQFMYKRNGLNNGNSFNISSGVYPSR